MSFEQTPQLNLEKIEEGKKIKEEEKANPEERIKEEKIIIDYFGEEKGKEIIEKMKEKPEIKEMVDYLIQDVFPYFGLTVEEEVMMINLFENDANCLDNVKIVARQSFKIARKELFNLFYQGAIEGLIDNTLKPFYEAKFYLIIIREEIDKLSPSPLRQNLLDYLGISEREIDEVIREIKNFKNLEQINLYLKNNSYFKDKWWAKLTGFRHTEESFNSINLEIKKIIEYIKTPQYDISLTPRKIEFLQQQRTKIEKEKIFEIIKEELALLEETGAFVCKNVKLNPITLKNILQAGSLMPVPALKNYLASHPDIPREEKKFLMDNLTGTYKDNPQYWNKILGFKEDLMFGSLIGGKEKDFQEGGAPAYGNIFFIFDIDKLEKRATASKCDTTFDRGRHYLCTLGVGKLLKVFKNANEKIAKTESGLLAHYVEVQISGTVNIEEAESININLSNKNVILRQDVLENAEKNNKYGNRIEYYEIPKPESIRYILIQNEYNRDLEVIFKILDDFLNEKPNFINKIRLILNTPDNKIIILGFKKENKSTVET